jgi:hypothetical protein
VTGLAIGLGGIYPQWALLIIAGSSAATAAIYGQDAGEAAMEGVAVAAIVIAATYGAYAAYNTIATAEITSASESRFTAEQRAMLASADEPIAPSKSPAKAAGEPLTVDTQRAIGATGLLFAGLYMAEAGAQFVHHGIHMMHGPPAVRAAGVFVRVVGYTMEFMGLGIVYFTANWLREPPPPPPEPVYFP